jgi:hypothetical protein
VTKAKAIGILNELFDSYLKMEKACLDTIIKVDGKQFTLRDKLDEITDEKIALLTAIDVLKQNPTVEAEHDKGWISVKDRMPEEGVDVLVYLNRKDADVDFVDRESGNFFYYDEGEVTHWRPLPEPPESEVEK